MYVTNFKNGDIKQKTFFKKYSNTSNKIKIKSCKVHYEKNVKENQESNFEMWKCIRSVINNKNNNVNYPKSIIDSDKTINSLTEIANVFNKNFPNIGKNLASSCNNSLKIDLINL